MSFSRAVINNAGKRDPKVPRQIWHHGERRAERYPQGQMERFVDLQGNVVQIQMAPPGVPPTPERVAQKRTQLHAKQNYDKSVTGFVEHDQCPLNNGVRYLKGIKEEFADLPEALRAPCDHEPKILTKSQRGLEMNDPCPHIQWLMAQRAEREAARRDARRTNTPDFQTQQIELAKQQAEDSRRVADKLTTVVESLAANKRGPRSE